MGAGDVRQLVYSRLVGSEPLQAMVEDRIWPMGSLGVGDIPAAPKLPCIMYAFGEAPAYTRVRETSKSVAIPLRIHVYGERGSYTDIDEIHRLVRDTLEGLGGQVSPSGRRCTDSVFLSLGPDSTSSQPDAATKVALYRITGPQ